MFPFEWNALRNGDRVLVHDDGAPGFDTRPGVIAIVQARRDRTNEVSIRIEATGRIERPRRQAVHQLPLDGSVTCWRCATASAPEWSSGTEAAESE